MLERKLSPKQSKPFEIKEKWHSSKVKWGKARKKPVVIEFREVKGEVSN